MNIFVPSKGRAGASKTIHNLLEEQVPFLAFVEPKDNELYRKAYPAIQTVTLPLSNQGIGYVRQFILAYARATLGLQCKHYWMLDDDISGMFVVENSKCVRKPFSKILDLAGQQIMARKDVAQGALEYQQFAWSQKFPFKFNSYCDVAVMINTELTKKINYRSEMDLKEDRDFTMQILHSGMRTMRTCWYAFGAPKNGSNKGGLHDDYARKGREEEASRRMILKWPQHCKFNLKPDGRPDVKIDWKAFQKR